MPSLTRSTILNLVSAGVPMVAAVVAMPFLVSSLGASRFGILALSWLVLGYFGAFDLGVSQALTRSVSRRLASEDHKGLREIIATGVCLSWALGLVAFLVLFALAPTLVLHVLSVPTALQHEALRTLQMMSVGLPFVIGASALRGVLEAHQRFDVVTAIRIPASVINFIGPLAVLPFTTSLTAIVSTLVVSRIVFFLIFAGSVQKLSTLSFKGSMHRTAATELLSYGGWLTITNIVGPLIVQSDRFLIGSLISTAAVAFYVAPYEMVARILVIPIAITTSTFPALARMSAETQMQERAIMDKSATYAFLGVFPILLIFASFSSELLKIWLGPEFASQGHAVLKLLAIGVLFNGLAYGPVAALQAAGRSDIVAKVHLVELPTYLCVLWWAIDSYGVVGAAAAWSTRTLVDNLVFVSITAVRTPHLRQPAFQCIGLPIAGSVAILICSSPTSITARLAAVTVVLICLAIKFRSRALAVLRR